MQNYPAVFAVVVVLVLGFIPGQAQSQSAAQPDANNLTYAVAWKQTAAEYRALFHQGFNIARMHVEKALAEREDNHRPLAVIADVDDTLLLSPAYWGYLVEQGKDFFDDPSWDNWVRDDQAEASPGALAFLQFCYDNNVEVFYVTNRDQGDDTFELALANLRSAGFPYVDAEHVTVLRESSNKEVVQQRLRESHDVVVVLGDNLNDFSRRYYVTDVSERNALMEQDSSRYGTEFVVFPNPTDGHWIRAVFGESEPAATDENRAVFRAAATRESWPGR